MSPRLRWVVGTIMVTAAAQLVVFTGGSLPPRREGRTADRVAAAPAGATDVKLGDGEQLLSAFAATKDPSSLARALQIVERLPPPDPDIDSPEQRRRRRAQLDLLLKVFVLADTNRDPLWDPRCLPVHRVRHADSHDPAAIHQFEKELAELDARDRRLEIQMRLSRIENDSSLAVASLVDAQYHATAEDQSELEEAIRRILPGHARARRFLAVVPR